jgi:hypothetical protein
MVRLSFIFLESGKLFDWGYSSPSLAELSEIDAELDGKLISKQ